MQSPSYAYQPDYEIDYSADHARREAPREYRRRRVSYARGGSRPTMANGIHRRRHKRISW